MLRHVALYGFCWSDKNQVRKECVKKKIKRTKKKIDEDTEDECQRGQQIRLPETLNPAADNESRPHTKAQAFDQ